MYITLHQYFNVKFENCFNIKHIKLIFLATALNDLFWLCVNNGRSSFLTEIHSLTFFTEKRGIGKTCLTRTSKILLSVAKLICWWSLNEVFKFQNLSGSVFFITNYNQIFMVRYFILQIACINSKPNFRAYDTYVNNNFISLKSLKMTSNSMHRIDRKYKKFSKRKH